MNNDMPRMATTGVLTSSFGSGTSWVSADSLTGPVAYPATKDEGAVWLCVTGDKKGDSDVKRNEEGKKRLVWVAVVDPHPDLDSVSSVVFLADMPYVTDDTDQEIWMGLDIQEILDAHNAVRVTMLDKEATRTAGRDIFLEPARIRDLSFAVIPLATFD